MNLFTVALASTLACQPVGDEKIVGLWESATTSRGGIGNNIEFRKDGSFITAMTVIVDLNYQVKEGKLYTGKKQGEPVSFENGKEISDEKQSLILIGKNGQKEIRKRTTPKVDNSIFGIYKYRHYTGAIAYERFTADGVMNFRLPMSSSKGCYELSNNKITLNIPGKKTNTIQFNFSEVKLVLTGKGNESIYNRVAEGAWYDSENIDYQKQRK